MLVVALLVAVASVIFFSSVMSHLLVQCTVSSHLVGVQPSVLVVHEILPISINRTL